MLRRLSYKDCCCIYVEWLGAVAACLTDPTAAIEESPAGQRLNQLVNAQRNAFSAMAAFEDELCLLQRLRCGGLQSISLA